MIVQFVLCILSINKAIGFIPLRPRVPLKDWKKTSIVGVDRRERCTSLEVVPPAGGLDQMFDPNSFAPVCGVSDSLYREAQSLVYIIAGRETFEEYAPLIAGALLRLRLELCVIESFVFEAILPFIRENGVSWVLPAQETVQTFLTGTIFAIAVNVIFVGSTKIISLVVTFFDVFLGMPTRFLSNLVASRKEPSDDIQEDITPLTFTLLIFGAFGKTLEVVRNVTEFFDVFVGRYLAILTVIYITLNLSIFESYQDFLFLKVEDGARSNQ